MNSTAGVSRGGANRRKKMLVLPELQGKVILLVLFLVLPLLLLNFVLVFGEFWSSGNSADPATYGMARSVTASILKSFGLTILVAIPFCIAAGIALSFRFGGPLYRIHRFMGDVKDGRWDQSCSLRKGDSLTFLRDDINGMMGAMCDRVRRQRTLLKEARELLDGGNQPDAEKIKALHAAISADLVLTAERLPEQGAAPAATAAGSPVREKVHA